MPEIKLVKQKYDLFFCHDCRHVIAYKQNTGDGHNCPICKSKLFVKVGTYKYDEEE